MGEDWMIETLENGGVGVIPTDTVYGIVASARDPEAFDRVYDLKERALDKACIVLIADTDDVEEFGIVLSDDLREKLSLYWPGPYSILLPVIDETFSYLHAGTGEIAFRIPDDDALRDFLRQTGPLIAPSANTEGDAPSTTADAARRYFGTSVDFYIDGGERPGPPSTIIRLREEDGMQVIRQ